MVTGQVLLHLQFIPDFFLKFFGWGFMFILLKQVLNILLLLRAVNFIAIERVFVQSMLVEFLLTHKQPN